MLQAAVFRYLKLLVSSVICRAQADGNSTGVGNPPGYCYKEQPAWSLYRESSFGHGTLDIVNSTHALWSCKSLPFAF